MRRTLLSILLSCGLLAAQSAADTKAAQEAFQARDWQSAARLYAALAEDHAGVETCYRLGYSLHALGRLDEALAWHRRAAKMGDQDPRLAATATYNIACVHALQGRKDDAFAALRLAGERGFRRAAQLQRDPDLRSLRDDARFADVVAALENAARLVVVVVHDGVETLDFAGPVEVFTAARDAHGNRAYRVRLVAPKPGPVTPQHWRATIAPDYDIGDCPQPAVIVIPGGDTSVLTGDEAFVDWVRRTAPKCEQVMSACSGAFVLAKAGLLDGVEATTHHNLRGALQRDHPAVKVVDRKVVAHERVVTAAGVSSGIDGALTVVQHQLGKQCAQLVAQYIEYEWQPAPDPTTQDDHR